MNTVTRNFGEIKMEYRAGNVSFSGSPQLPPVGMKLTEAIAAAKATLATLAIAFQRLDEISDDDFSADEASELRKALDIRSTLDMSEDEYIDYLATMREDGIYDGVSAHWGHD